MCERAEDDNSAANTVLQIVPKSVRGRMIMSS